MLAEIFMLRVETATREAAQAETRFVPITALAGRDFGDGDKPPRGRQRVPGDLDPPVTG